MTTPAVLYLHGFLSSPASAKGRLLADEARRLGWDCLAPDWNLPPREVDALLRNLMRARSPETLRKTLVVGSSLGGFYALRLAQEFGLPAALVNPCLEPWEFVVDSLGEQKVFGTERVVQVKASFADDFRALAREVPPLPVSPQKLLLLLSTKDEVLDHRAALEAFRDSPRLLSVGDDHRMQRFAEYLPAAAAFLRAQ